MKTWILHIHDWLNAHKRVAGVMLALLLALSILSALRLDFQEDISAFLPQKPQVRGEEKMAVLFEGGSLEEKVDAMFAFEEKWNSRYPDFPISARADESPMLESFDSLRANWPYYLLEEDYARMDSLLAQPGYIAACLAEGKDNLISSNVILSRYLRSDPLKLFAPVLQRFRSAAPPVRMEEGCLFTEDGTCGILLFDSPYGGTESSHNAELVAGLTEVKEAVMADMPRLRITSTGAAEVAVENASRIKKDSFLALAMAAILISLLLWFSYKRLSDVVWILISTASGAVFALGLIALFRTSVSIIILGIGCTIIGIAVNYPLHYIDHLKYSGDRRKALADQVNPLLVGNITTVGAFLSLLLLKAEALHDFGFIAAMMLVGTILFVLLFLPLFVRASRGSRKALKLDFDRHIRLNAAGRRRVFCAFLLLTLLFVFGGKRLSFDSNLHHINYMTPAQAQGFAVLERMQPAPMEQLPSAEAVKNWNAFWAAHPDVGERLIDEALAQGFTAHAFQPFFDTIDREWPVREEAASFATSLVAGLSEDFDTIGLLCSLIVFFFLWLSFGNLELGIICFLPLAVSWIWIRGIMGLTGLSFNIVNMILATFIFGQGDDYTIFMTEGLLYERATGKKILHSFKNAVALSALIMFVGIGVLVFAKHPAMRSLGQVTVIGMLTVVLMAYYLPPLLFRWLTSRRGAPRKTPLTLSGLLGSAYIFLQMAVWMSLLSVLALFVPKGQAYHRIVCKMASRAVRLIPGCPFKLHNPGGEDFSRPAVYICNHQSHLDVLALIALQPKLVFMTNDWVWNFPFYGLVVRKCGYFPSSRGLAENIAYVREMVAQGYSPVIFPEGTRSEDGSVGRFHRGAFAMARELGLDILPLCLHGFHEALPKHDFLLRRGALSLEVGERIGIPEKADLAAFTRDMRSFYKDWYDRIRSVRETASYLAPSVYRQYLYKGHDARMECRRVLRKAVYERIDALTGEECVIREAGCGVQALLTALTHPEMKVTAYEADEDKYLTATRCELPENLNYRNA